MKKSELHKIIREELQNHLIEESIVNWMLDKAEDFVKGAIHHKTEYQFARIYNDPEFRALSKKFGMNEKEFVDKATKMIKADPKRFEKILAYDVQKSKYKKFFGL